MRDVWLLSSKWNRQTLVSTSIKTVAILAIASKAGMKITAGRRPKFDHITKLAIHFSSNRSLWPAKKEKAPKSSRLVFAEGPINALRVSFLFRNRRLRVPPRLHRNVYDWNGNFFEDTCFAYTKTVKTCTKMHENVHKNAWKRARKRIKTFHFKNAIQSGIVLIKNYTNLMRWVYNNDEYNTTIREKFGW